MRFKLLVGLISLIYIALSVNSALRGGDFHVYLDAAIKLNSHQNIYAPPFFGGLQYYYSPLFALILIPFSSSFFSTELFWLLLSGFFLYRTGVLVLKYFNLSVLSKKEINLLLIVSSFFVLRFLLYNISMIQITFFLLWAIFESIDLINNKKWVLGSSLLALAINIKLMPLVIVPYLIYRRKFKAFAGLVIISMFYVLLPSIFIGHEFNMYLLTEWWEIINPMNTEHLIEADKNSQSLVGLVPVFLTETSGSLEISRNILSLSTETAVKITNIVRLLLVCFTLYFLKSPFLKTIDKISEIRALSYICLLVPLIFPHQQKYAFIFLFPMVIYLTYYSLVMWKYNRSMSFKIYLSLLLIVSLILSPLIGSDVIGRYNYDLIHHFRLLGFTAISFIIFAVIGSPEKLKNK